MGSCDRKDIWDTRITGVVMSGGPRAAGAGEEARGLKVVHRYKVLLTMSMVAVMFVMVSTLCFVP